MSEIFRSQFFLPMAVLAAMSLVLLCALYFALRKLRNLGKRQRILEGDIRKLEGQLDQAHRMEAVGILAGSIVNNLNNLLAVILGHTRIANNELGPDAPARDELDRIAKAGHMATELVREISDFYLQADRPRRAAAMLEKARTIAPDSDEIAYHLALAYQDTHRPTEARDLLTGLSQDLGPGHPLRREVEDALASFE